MIQLELLSHKHDGVLRSLPDDRMGLLKAGVVYANAVSDRNWLEDRLLEQKQRKAQTVLGIDGREKLAGLGRLARLSSDDSSAQLSYYIAPEFRGQGIAFQVARSLLDNHLFPGLIALESFVEPSGVRSQEILVALGFRRVAIGRSPTRRLLRYRLKLDDAPAR